MSSGIGWEFWEKEWLIHYGRWFGVSEQTIHHLQKDMETHIGKILFTAKLTLGFVIPTLVAAGLAKIPWRRWFGGLFLAECLWTGFLVFTGHYFGRYVQTLERGPWWVSLGGAAVFVVLILVYLSRRHCLGIERRIAHAHPDRNADLFAWERAGQLFHPSGAGPGRASGHQVMVVTSSEGMRSYSSLDHGVQVEKTAALPCISFILPFA